MSPRIVLVAFLAAILAGTCLGLSVQLGDDPQVWHHIPLAKAILLIGGAAIGAAIVVVSLGRRNTV